LDKRLYLILGNGFSMDMLAHIGHPDMVDVRNLFRFGSHVRWPVDGEPGFLSFKHCPNLWNLGARPNMSESDALSLIEDIITCVNIFCLVPPTARISGEPRPNDIYIFAYKELSIYLKHLFIYYDTKARLTSAAAESWPWCKFLVHAVSKFSDISIVTYNYDIWLERALIDCGVKFNLALMGEPGPLAKITILKPHGSISFAHKVVLGRDAFRVALDREVLDGSVSDFDVRYDKLDENYVVSALIPPAGESGRLNHTWAGQMRAEAKRRASELGSADEVIIGGLSYWHVDRAELDELLISFDRSINIKMINPNPSRAMSAVLASLFDNYIAYNSARVLEDLIS
jgi:hypothetical protein